MDNLNSPDSGMPQNKPFAGMLPQKSLPNSTATLVLGIVSIVPGCFCFGVVGLVCGIIALVISKKDLILYNSNPAEYSVSSYNNLKAGRVCAIIGIVLSSLYFLYIILYFVVLGAAFSMVPWGSLN